jgi:hypothetical protein
MTSIPKLFVLTLACQLACISALNGQGEVLLVLGSDTAIWDGMDVGKYHCTYSDALYTDPARNGYAVMDPSFRNQLVDSYNQTVKFTWWMMGGNIFRYATNKNVPLPNTMTPYLMQKYHGEAIKEFGDELSIHYHTFVWTDYNGDGIFWWNQAHGFEESRQDFFVTLAQYLLEEGVYPVSFRSGWHYMDNDWQQCLDSLLLFSMHDDWPAKRTSTTEPIDNVYDWSQSSSEWTPFHPSPDNYQLPGTCKGWNLRSKHIGSVDSTMMNAMFARADSGVTQVACLWGHLPETDFLDNMKKINGLAHAAALKYPRVKFRYCTAVEAMQRWLGASAAPPPTITIAPKDSGETMSVVVRTNEPIFQEQPFLAIKDIYERYSRVIMQRTGTNEWTTVDPIPTSTLAKLGVAVTDTVGNLATAIVRYLPDDLYIDNRDSGYAEVRGAWSTISQRAWGIDARSAVLVQGDSAEVIWRPALSQSCRYNIWVQVPSVSNPAGKALFRVLDRGQVVDTAFFANPLTPGDWVYVATAQLEVDGMPTIEMVVNGDGQAGKVIAADALKLSALIRDRQIAVSNTSVDFGEVSEADTARFSLTLQNLGVTPLTVTSLYTRSEFVFPLAALPVVVPAMQSVVLPVGFYSETKGVASDSLFIESNDPLQPIIGVPVTANVIGYFTIVDNADSTTYEEYGSWYYSNAQAYGATSRYSPTNSGPGTYARYSTTLKKSGVYDVQMIVPKTENASTRARYVLSVGNAAVDSAFLDQNANSGSWVTVLTRLLPQGTPIDVTVSDASPSPSGSVVLRADALRFLLREDLTTVEGSRPSAVPLLMMLRQNYPNPFNPTTHIAYAIPKACYVRLRVFDMLGREVAVLVDGNAEPAWYTVTYQAQHLPSGVYLYRLEAGGFVQTKKMVLLK